MKNNQSPFCVNLHELPRRAGEMRTYHLEFQAPDDLGTPLLAIAKGTPLVIDFKAESVDDGILISGNIRSTAKGECGRCLDPIVEAIDQDFQELFFYEGRAGDEDAEDLFTLDGDSADIEIPIRDAVILRMPLNPLCDPECEGLCSECGEKWATLPEGHSHEKIDPRWSGLQGWSSSKDA